MKKILTLLLLSSLLSCNNDDDNNTTESLSGSWNMETYTAFMEELPQLNDGDIIWTFNSNNTVTVTNTVDAQYPYMLDSGTYSSTLENNLMTIENYGSYYYSIDGSLLNMEHTAASVDAGPIITFSKLN